MVVSCVENWNNQDHKLSNLLSHLRFLAQMNSRCHESEGLTGLLKWRSGGIRWGELYEYMGIDMNFQ